MGDSKIISSRSVGGLEDIAGRVGGDSGTIGPTSAPDLADSGKTCALEAVKKRRPEALVW
jgi:hypothetical protein